MDISWTTVVATAITSAINGTVTFLIVRYVGKAADHVESKANGKKRDED